jgi:cell division protease FtsH
VFLGAALQDMGAVGPHTLDIIDEETERIVEDAKARARAVLQRNWSAVEETARSLVEHETLSGVALDAVLSTVQPVDLQSLPPAEREVDARRRGSGDPR